MGSASSGAPDGLGLKTTKRHPGKADAQAQRAFVEEYHTFRTQLPSDQAIGFLDESGFEHNSRPARCLLRKGKEKDLPSNSGYKRLNVLGGVILQELEVDVVYPEGTINADLVKAYLKALEPKLSFQKLHLFLDNASLPFGLPPWPLPSVGDPLPNCTNGSRSPPNLGQNSHAPP